MCLRWYEQDSDPTNVLTLVNLATRKYRVLPHLKLEDFEDHGDGLCQCECGCVNFIDDDEQEMEETLVEVDKAEPEEHSNEDGEMQSLPLEETEQHDGDGALQPVVKVINYDDGDTHLFVYSLKENAWRKVKNSCSPYSLRDVIGACPSSQNNLLGIQ
ncbi:hypothetical protein ACFE04_027992 [Oxalis oulophora]